jgi:rhomboid family protein
MNQYRPVLSNIPPVVKNLIIINVMLWLATIVLIKTAGIDLVNYLGLFYPASEHFWPFQIFTHMFMHDPNNIFHILFNMFALWMFGRVLESVWGPKRFLFFYLVCGLGAAASQTFVNYLEISHIQNFVDTFINVPSADRFYSFVVKHKQLMAGLGFNDGNGYHTLYDYAINLANEWLNNPASPDYQTTAISILHQFVQVIINIPTIGASGAIFGILLAFGMLFPNTQLMLIFPPIPIKAKYFVIGYGLIELYSGLARSGSHIAHFAHLGGMLFGFIMLKYWNKTNKNFY